MNLKLIFGALGNIEQFFFLEKYLASRRTKGWAGGRGGCLTNLRTIFAKDQVKTILDTLNFCHQVGVTGRVAFYHILINNQHLTS